MASGSYNIDTFSWYRSLPLSNDTQPFSTLTMFAVGPSSFMKNYTFYDYTWANGFPDTSTFSTSITSFVDAAFASTVSALGRVFVSTIPYTRWIDGSNIYQYPVPGGIPETYDFVSTYTDQAIPYPSQIMTPSVWLGEGMSRIINSKQYNVFVDSQYSLQLVGSNAPYTWVSTIGLFSNYIGTPYGPANRGRVQTTRVGSNQYIDVHSKMMYVPQDDDIDQIMPFTSSFYLDIYLHAPAGTLGSNAPNYDIYIPGNNNLTFTCVPAVSTITVY